MKTTIKNRLLCSLLGCLFLFGSCQQKPQPEPATAQNFKMSLRLWPNHHNDTILRSELLQALKEYPGTFDDVWFCMELNTLSTDAHRKSAMAMATASRQLREAGIETAVQGITIGHGDNFESGSEALIPTRWGTVTDAGGVRTRNSNCPRQPAFLDYLAEVYSLYAQPVQPAVVWLDDDLRITRHSPARQLCFCDTCIGIFNRQTYGNWTRETLAAALEENADSGTLREQWVRFNQKSLAQVAAVISRSVHRVSPSTRMGLQHANFHRELLEGRDWNLVFDAMQEETGMIPASRPGNGFYNDHAPREMLLKAYDMARQIRRLKPGITDITAEVEGYRHCATGKSPHGLCVESLLYLSLGATQLSYAIICAASEPMDWYAGHYFKTLATWRPLYQEYAAFNRGTEPGGINPYISPGHITRNMKTGEPPLAWTTTNAGDVLYALAPLGIPFCPDGNNAAALLLDAPAVEGLTQKEAAALFQTQNILLDAQAWQSAKQRQIDTLLTPISLPEGLTEVSCFTSANGGRTAVIPSYDASVSHAQRINRLHIADWLSGNRLPVIPETPAQAVVVPRVDAENRLRSVTLLNVSISGQPVTQLRLRGCPPDRKASFVWKKAGTPDQVLSPQYDGTDVIVRIPALEGWNIGWLAIVP